MSPEDAKPPRRRRRASEAATKRAKPAGEEKAGDGSERSGSKAGGGSERAGSKAGGGSKPRRSPPRASGAKAKPAAAKAKPPGRPRRPTRKLPGRLGAGESIYLFAAILLFALMFFDWYGLKATTSGTETLGGAVSGAGGGSAWDTLEVIPLFLMLAIVVAVGSAVLKLSGSSWRPTIPASVAVCLLGLLAALLILIRIISPPSPSEALSELAFEATLRVPVFLALAAGLGIAYGGWRAMGEEGTTFAGIAQRLESPDRPRKPKPAGRTKP